MATLTKIFNSKKDDAAETFNEEEENSEESDNESQDPKDDSSKQNTQNLASDLGSQAGRKASFDDQESIQKQAE